MSKSDEEQHLNDEAVPLTSNIDDANEEPPKPSAPEAPPSYHQHIKATKYTAVAKQDEDGSDTVEDEQLKTSLSTAAPPSYHQHTTKKKEQYSAIPTTHEDQASDSSSADDIQLAKVEQSKSPKTTKSPQPKQTASTKIAPMEIAPLHEGDGNKTSGDDTNACDDCCSCEFKCDFSDMSRRQKLICWGAFGAICGVCILLTIILIPVSIRRVEYDEYAVRYDDLTKEASSEEYSEGRYILTPQTKLFKYDALIQKTQIELECMTRDGIMVEIDVDILYFIPQDAILEIWNEFGKEAQIESYFVLVVSGAIRGAIGGFYARDFYKNRYLIQGKIDNDIQNALHYSKTHLVLVSALLSRYNYPDELSEVIQAKREAENTITIVTEQRDGNITDAETLYVVSKIYAQQLKIQTVAEVAAVLNEAKAKAKAVKARFEYIQDLFESNMRHNNFTAKQFVDYWLSAFVLLEANEPWTTTLEKPYDSEISAENDTNTTTAP